MKISKSPQRNDKYKLEYEETEVDILKVTYIKGDFIAIEFFDFSDMPNGESTEIVTEELPINPILKAKRVDGQLEVVVLQPYSREEKALYEGGTL